MYRVTLRQSVFVCLYSVVFTRTVVTNVFLSVRDRNNCVEQLFCVCYACSAHPKQHDQHSFNQILSELLVADLT